MFKDKNILIGLTGGIACYKICELIRMFKRDGANVKVVATPDALEFVTITTLQTLSQNKVYFEQFTTDWRPEHISLSDWADIFVIAPATANTIAKIANGICDNLLTSTVCAFNKQVVIAPAMNCNMWNNEITQQNIKKVSNLKNYYIIAPENGFLACNVNGAGRMAEPKEIYETIEKILFTDKFLANKKFIVTAGGTREAIDPIRCISNYGSGKMGIAMADAIYEAGGEVVLITTVPVEKSYEVMKAESTIDILNNIKNNFTTETNVIMTASISDFRPEVVSDHKIKKNGDDGLTIKLIQNPDVLKEIAKMRGDQQKIVGFCAETENLVDNAIKKIKSKNLDYIVANDVSRKDIGLSSDNNEVIIIDKDLNQTKIDKDTKINIARKILKKIFKEDENRN